MNGTSVRRNPARGRPTNPTHHTHKTCLPTIRSPKYRGDSALPASGVVLQHIRRHPTFTNVSGIWRLRSPYLYEFPPEAQKLFDQGIQPTNFHVLIRFGNWEDILEEPAYPEG
ncbi:hypothetical protein [Pelagicoccus sp. SDUM812002]|uniref:hypothetical protein n=1 Tax=Pelagicoccus sp. SDUM812002 TaxID=3041266 RepID=UPI0028101939|nr:hypothetical protein [Pelagicoccus sp. SDUM812002]MDQ8185772.1 hypothetical protein [Pelagicoccus sp. SDUM812002]